MRILKQSIKNLTKAYYSPRTKKVFNLIEKLEDRKELKVIFAGCVILFEKNHIIFTKQRKN